MKPKRLLLCPALALLLTVNAFALEVPTSTVTQNLNGIQQAIKTYTLPPDADPQQLIEEPFELEGYLYTFADITKKENLVEDSQPHRETVTVETSKKDLSSVLEELPSTMEYDDGTYKGTLALDHTTIHTEAAGYDKGSRTITAVKTIGPLDRNDMSYVPATTVKDGRTLSLTGVDWQVIGTDLVGETLTPSSYQAVATYSGKASYSYATGYVSTAEYVGEVARNEVESVTYTVLYTGEIVSPAEPAASEDTGRLPVVVDAVKNYWPTLLAGVGAVALAVFVVLYLRERRKNQDAEYINVPFDSEETEGHDREN